MSKPDFNAIKKSCHGMMRPEVYEKIYDTALYTKGKCIVEIGTAHGAATICLAKALQDSGRSDGIVYTFDTFTRTNRKEFDKTTDHYAFVLKKFEEFGVSNNIKAIKGNIKETHLELSNDERITLLMLDSDGQIDRDFQFFYNQIEPGGSLIIDDMADRVRVSDKITHYRIDQKHKLTYHLTNSAEKFGLIEKTDMEYQTWFGIKLNSKVDQWPKTKILSAYRELVFGKANKF